MHYRELEGEKQLLEDRVRNLEEQLEAKDTENAYIKGVLMKYWQMLKSDDYVFVADVTKQIKHLAEEIAEGSNEGSA